MSSESPTPEAEHDVPVRPEPASLSLLSQRTEALLFATQEPLSVEDLGRLLSDSEEEPLPEAAVRGTLRQLEEILAGTNSALVIQEISGGYRLSTRPLHSSSLQRLFNEESNRGLSSAALETMAIVAYRQPVTRSEVEKIRGVGCGPILRALLERKLIRIIGHQTGAVGRPHLYGTTPLFLEVFGLRDLNDLPELEPRFDEAEPPSLSPTPPLQPAITPPPPAPAPGPRLQPRPSDSAWTWGQRTAEGSVDSPKARDKIRTFSPGLEDLSPTESPMLDTPLLDQHKQLGGRIVDFAGWNMPVVYSSINDEHAAVRERVGLFDLSHMGRLILSGDGICQALDRMVPADLTKLKPGQAKYSFFLTDDGTFIDDILIYARPDDYYVVVNASNRESVLEWLDERLDGDVADTTLDQAMLAIQGPRAVALIDRLAEDCRPSDMSYYSFGDAMLFGVPVTIARTGYTGEDGFEIYIPVEHAAGFWSGLLEEGQSDGILPCGLGARDTLRLEAAMALYGHEIDRQTNPVEARLSWAVAWDKQEFIGQQAIQAVKEAGPAKKLVGLELDCKRVPRQDQDIYHAEQQVGRVTSGTVSPTLNKRIAMAFVRPDLAKLGTALAVDIRGNQEPAQVIKLPFYKRPG